MTFAYKTDAALMFAMLKPWDERPRADQSSQALAGQLMMQFMQSKDAFVIPVNPPPIMGMSTTVVLKCGYKIERVESYMYSINMLKKSLTKQAKTQD